MKTPRFWRYKGVVSTALLPVSSLYRLLRDARLRGQVAKTLPVPVLCVGNLTAGGAGKTPVVLALLDWLGRQGCAAHCISRGYGGSLYGPVRVDTQEHSAAEVGDEPLLIAAHSPCWVGKRRLSVATAAVLDGAQVIVMDDGLQNPTVKKDLSLLVIDGGYGMGNGRLLPAGPLRESLAEGVAKAQAAVLVGEDETGVLSLLPSALPVLKARLEPQEDAQRWRGRKLVAFAGIGRPEKFYSTLATLGAEVVKTFSFADHHPYTQTEIDHMRRDAAQRGAELVTTEKDAMRLTPPMREGIGVVRVRLVFAQEAELEKLCMPLLVGQLSAK